MIGIIFVFGIIRMIALMLINCKSPKLAVVTVTSQDKINRETKKNKNKKTGGENPGTNPCDLHLTTQ